MIRGSDNTLFRKIEMFFRDLVRSRILIIGAFFAILGILLIRRLYVLQIIQGESYLQSFKYIIQKDTELPSSRGSIYDRNGKLIAYNRLATSVTIEDSSLLESNADRNEMLYRLIQLIEGAGYTTINNLPLEIDADGNVEYTASGNTLLRFIRNVYGKDNIDQLTDEQKKTDAQTLFNYMCEGDDDESMFGIDRTIYTPEESLKICAIRYEIYMKRYEQYLSVTVASDINDTLVAQIKENAADLPGVSIAQDYVRQYEDSIYFSNITGYCGEISEDELEAFENEGQDDYASGDTIGKTGLESQFESQLRGSKGSQTVYVDNLGNILEVAERTESSPGDDLYLTIDKDYQIQAYNLLEEEIAGIVLDKIGTDIQYNDIYFALIENGIIDISRFDNKNATDLEKSVYKLYTSQESSQFDVIKKLIDGSNNNTYNDCSEEEREYINVVEDILSEQNILDEGKLSEEDEIYQSWSVGTASLYDYLRYAISKDAIVVSAMDVSDSFLDSEEIYTKMADYLMTELEDNLQFQKIIYHALIDDGSLSGATVCQLLYDQDVFEPDEDYENLLAGVIDASGFIQSKIYNLEITPGMLALDPCSGSMVVTDPTSGEVLALVSYPGYDANRVNEVDYYSMLVQNQSLPLYNRACLQKTAPGSTFKMIVAAAGLEEGVITTDTYITDLITFEKVQPSANCWETTYGHGSIEVTDAIKESCNYFFYEVGYQLGINSSGNYNSNYGIQRLRKYMADFGLDRTSGIELEESSPSMSDTDSVLTSIGQAKNSYTASQLARYNTTLASRGTVYSLSILDKLTSSDGTLIEDYTPEILDHLEYNESTWDSIYSGMNKVLSNSSLSSIYGDLNVSAAGKTGTAQEDLNRPDHGLFVCFAPYEDPTVTITVVLPFGYGSSNSSAIAKNMLAYIFHETTDSDGTRHAASTSGRTTTD